MERNLNYKKKKHHLKVIMGSNNYMCGNKERERERKKRREGKKEGVGKIIIMPTFV